jgi:hypothetical protein
MSCAGPRLETMETEAVTLRVDPRDTELVALSSQVSEAEQVPARALHLQLLLHLPRLAGRDGTVAPRAVTDEAVRLARVLSSRYARRPDWSSPPTALLQVTDLELRRANVETARIVLENFHYLGSYRPDSDHFAGVIRSDPERIAAFLSLSRLDVLPLAEVLPTGVDASSTAVLSRVFAFDWAPANGISFLFGQLFNRLRRERLDLRLLLTYVNPNLGFTGASYRASNWVPFAFEDGTRYAYLNGAYVTDRLLERVFGTADSTLLQRRLGTEIVFSTMPLRPLEVYAYPLDSHLRRTLATRSPVTVARGTS